MGQVLHRSTATTEAMRLYGAMMLDHEVWRLLVLPPSNQLIGERVNGSHSAT